MRSIKQYSNQTFTKRVDHEGGLHRQQQNPRVPSFCKECGAAFSNGRWAKSSELSETRLAQRRSAQPIVCPACRQIANNTAGGYISIDGAFYDDHRAEIQNLVKNEAEQALENNPLSRIMKKHEIEGRFLVETTTEHLAQRIGRALERAYAGTASFDFSHENKVVRVTWHRD